MRVVVHAAFLAATVLFSSCGGGAEEPTVVAVYVVDPFGPDESYWKRADALALARVRPVSVRCGKFTVDKVRNPNEEQFIHPGGVVPYLLYFEISESDFLKVSNLEWFGAPLSARFQQLLVAPKDCGPLPESIRS